MLFYWTKMFTEVVFYNRYPRQVAEYQSIVAQLSLKGKHLSIKAE